MDTHLTFDVITLFPALLEGVVDQSIIGRAVGNGKIGVGLHNLRDWADGPHNMTDDRPFGGGRMVLKPEPLFRAIENFD